MPKAKRQAGTKPTKKKAARKVAKKATKKRAPVNSKARAVKAAAKKAARKAAPKKKTAKKRKPTAAAKSPKRQESFLALAMAENPGITSEQLAIKYDIQPEDVFKMRHFVHEYLKDFDIISAGLRMGYDKGSVKGAANMLFYHSFTQLRLSEVMADLEEKSVVSGGQIMAKLWQEANLGQCSDNSSVRVGALKELARIKQMGVAATNKPARISGVMLVPIIQGDAAEGLLSWEDKAKASQAALKEGAIDIE